MFKMIFTDCWGFQILTWLSYTCMSENRQTFGAFLLTLFPRCPVLVSRPSCLGRRVPVLL